MKRVIITGASGSGKSTLAAKLARIFGLKHIDLDEYYWLSNWQVRETNEFINIIKNLTKSERWIVSGGNSMLMDYLLSKADTKIWLDYNIITCMIRAFSRSIKRIINKEKCCGENYESFRQLFFSRNSILLWVISSYRKRKIANSKIFSNKIKGIKYLRFNNPAETSKWVKSLTLNENIRQ